MLEILVFPDMNNLVQGPYLSVPEGRQGRNFHTLRQRFAKILLGLRHCTGFQRIGTKFVDTHRAFLSLANLRLPRRFFTEPELPSTVLYAPHNGESKCLWAMPRYAGAVCGHLSYLADGSLLPELYAGPPEYGHGAIPSQILVWR